ncbi:MAG: hypothetical protein AABZ47_01430 [Planctomycetota bacterium]
MLCRGTVVADPPLRTRPLDSDFPNTLDRSSIIKPIPWPVIFLAIAVTTGVLASIPGRFSIAPLIESDYAYQLIAADRVVQGHGLTSLQPIAPRQPWTWEYDFGYLTQWPPGYSILVASVRWCLNCPTVQACQWISTMATAIALVGWFTWTRACTPRGICGIFLALASAALAVNTTMFLNPSTDLLVVAASPFILILATHRPFNDANLLIACFAAGLLFWFRYASLFLPAGLLTWLIIERLTHRKFSWRQVTTFGISSVIPILAMLIIHRLAAPSTSLQSQLNLGNKITLNACWTHVITVWWNLTNLGYYDHRTKAHWLFALWPILGIALVMMSHRGRFAIAKTLRTPSFALAVIVTFTLAAMLVTATTLFASKYDYVDLPRYYAPVIPLYFTLWVAPVVNGFKKPIRFALSIGLLFACSWTFNQTWLKNYQRLRDSSFETTHYGQRAVAFTPGASELYRWLSEQNTKNWIIVSNFHEYLTLETGIPALPIPSDRSALDDWITRITQHRGIQNPRIVFILDPDHHWRSQYLPPVDEILSTFDLRVAPLPTPQFSARLFEYKSNPFITTLRLHGIPGDRCLGPASLPFFSRSDVVRRG